ncbi:MAG: HAMP domain-containing histidine kinase [Planctomycetes bacterium]|nr:HAMP domain-containing histidine kinase [Planctomycetota bacterium]
MPIAIRHTLSITLLTFAVVAIVVSARPDDVWWVASIVAMLVGSGAWLVHGRALGALSEHLGEGRPTRTMTHMFWHVDRLRRDVSDANSRASFLERSLVEERELLQGVVDNTVHELRTPLTTVLATIEMARSGMLEDPIDTDELFRHAHSACHHMLFMINDLLDASALRSGVLRLEPRRVSLSAVAANAEGVLQPIAQVSGIELRFQCEQGLAPMWADEMRTMQVLFNLVGNAIKYSEPGGHVDVSVDRFAEGLLRVEVRDDGLGVPEDKRSNLFGRFARVHDPNDSTASGTGIGLNFSKMLVERMGGEIGYRPREGGPGSVFWFTVPTAEPPAAVGVALESSRAEPAPEREPSG